MRSNIGPASIDRAGPDATPLWLGMGAEKNAKYSRRYIVAVIVVVVGR